ncbi:MAG: hypothetical protein P9M15_07440 [Candidatus Electryoneaceae bacterium]|nr:hypothetical protein [Candidatus Electryoneaceae bacterium]
MSIVVQKFGGKLLATPEKIRQAADYIIATKNAGESPVVIVSALGHTTDQFVRMAYQVAEHPDSREMDMLLSVGERTSMSLLAMAINADDSYQAVSYTGSQVGIITDTHHTNARIIEVKGYRISEALQQEQIPIIGGFQGISTDKEITTLGRGGSDATAVALAVALGAVRCELIKEHGGVFSADPIIEPEALLRGDLDYDTLEAIMSSGAKVIQPRAAALARQHRVTLSVKKLDGTRGTLVSDRALSSGQVVAVTLEDDLTAVRLDPAQTVMDIDVPSNRRVIVWSDRGGIIAVKGEWDRADGFPVSLVTVIGWGGALSKEVTFVVLGALADAGIGLSAVTGMGGRIGLLVDCGEGERTVKIVHNICREHRFIV